MNVNLRDPIPVPVDEPLEKTRHFFEEGQRGRVVSGRHAGRTGKLEAINAHDGHVVRLDDGGHLVEYLHSELEPESFGETAGGYTRVAKVDPRDPFGGCGDGVGDSLQKAAAGELRVGARVRGFDGKVGTITKIHGDVADVELDDGGSGTSLIRILQPI